MGNVSERKIEEAEGIIEDISKYIYELINKAEAKHRGKRFDFIEVDTVTSYGIHDLCLHTFKNREFINVKYRFFLEQHFDAESLAKGYGGRFCLIIEATIIDMVYYASDVHRAKSDDTELAKSIQLRPFSNPVWRDNIANNRIRESKEVEDYYNDIKGILEDVNDYIKMYHKKSGIHIFSTYKDIRVYFRDHKGKPEQYREYFMDQYIMTLCKANKIVGLDSILENAKKYGLNLDVSYAGLLKHILDKQDKGREIGPVPHNLLESNLREELNKKLPVLIERLKKIVADESNQKFSTNNSFSIVKKEVYNDGAWYEGEFKEGKWNGNGTYCWPDGGKYVGQFLNGSMHGEGILYHTNGTSNKVIYNNGNVISTSPNIIRENYSDGAWYEGEMKDGQRHGQGTYCWANGNKYIGGWFNGSMHGNGVIYYYNGVKEEVTCDNGNYIKRNIIR